MLHFIALFTAIAVIATGIYVMVKGEWFPFGLKFAGICLSTLAAMWLLSADIYLGGSVLTCPATMPSNMCMTFELYHVLRNVAFIIFHIAIGRDAIHYKKRDRRGTLQCQKNSSKQLRAS